MEDPKNFSNFSISQDLIRAIADMGFEEATPIQTMAIPLILEGRDITGQAQTGTGKTAAFGLPIIDRIDPHDNNVQALVLAPTRELAIQIAEEFARFGQYKKGLSIVPVYGGQPIERQFRALKAGAQIVIGTPGRI
ncbi:MAG: DEAD/DEAH box helicase, partial [Methanocalculus sp. MSAO_Arc2]|uniref:DEAD/DEAH box helicase n=1 Tax=Methanocalculus sp. MSAO_Arc2 TaxID=2293855 RepID=UPI000FEF1771